MRHVVVALVLAVWACAHPKDLPETPAKPATPKEVVAAGRALIEQWRQAYEVRSVDALSKLYAHDLDLVVVLDGLPLNGWTSVETMLKDRLAHAKEVHVRLKDVQITTLAPTAAFAVATMTRELGDGVTTVTENGALTLVLRSVIDPEKTSAVAATRWLIVAEHYSYRRP
jgi:ketosteroid isomerase-like protein